MGLDCIILIQVFVIYSGDLLGEVVNDSFVSFDCFVFL